MADRDKPFYKTVLNPITMFVDSNHLESIRTSNLKSEERNRIKKSIESYRNKK